MSQHEEAVNFLQPINHMVFYASGFKYEFWTFYTTEAGTSVLNKLESKTGTIHIKKLGNSQPIVQAVEDYYHHQFQLPNTRTVRCVKDICAFVNKYKKDILFAAECQQKTEATIEQLGKLIGRQTSIGGTEWGWYVRAKKLYLKIFVDVTRTPIHQLFV